jgi:hypothetical protein
MVTLSRDHIKEGNQYYQYENKKKKQKKKQLRWVEGKCYSSR